MMHSERVSIDSPPQQRAAAIVRPWEAAPQQLQSAPPFVGPYASFVYPSNATQQTTTSAAATLQLLQQMAQGAGSAAMGRMAAAEGSSSSSVEEQR